MKIQKLLIGTVVSTVFLFLVDWLWYGMIMKDSMANMPGMRPEPDMMWLVISYIIFSLAFVSIYGAWAKGDSKVSCGLNYGIWITVLAALAMNLMWYSLTTTMTLSQSLTDVGYSLVKYVILGILVAFATGIPESGGSRGDTPGKGSGGGQG